MNSSSLKIVYSIVFQVYGLVFYLLARIFFQIRIYCHQEKILSEEKKNDLGSIFVAPHLSCWDPILIAAAFWELQFRHIFLYGTTRYVAKDNLRTLFGCFPRLSSYVIFINQKYQKSAIREMIDLLRKGINIVIFPEGTVVPEKKKVGGLVCLVLEQVEKMTNQKVAVFPLKIEAEGPYGKPEGNWLGYLLRKVKAKVKIGDRVLLDDVEKMISISKEAVFNKYRREEIVTELLNIADKI